jgi:hypothetical protein
MSKLNWFKFTPSDWTMGKISRTSLTIQGEFIRFCCIYWNKDCWITESTAKQELSDKTFKTLISRGVIKSISAYTKISDTTEQVIRIDFLDEQLNDIHRLKQIASKAGQASAEARRKIKQNSTHVQRNPTDKIEIEKENHNILFREFNHLSITIAENNKLLEEYSQETINQILDSIENYKQNVNYKSLYLTARSWLRNQPKKIDNIRLNPAEQEIDNFATNVMLKIKGK